MDTSLLGADHSDSCHSPAASPVETARILTRKRPAQKCAETEEEEEGRDVRFPAAPRLRGLIGAHGCVESRLRRDAAAWSRGCSEWPSAVAKKNLDL